MAAMVPVPSMCPETICPPNRPFAAIARSRLTALPGRSCPKLERRSVSGITSAEKEVAANCVTVRQTPFTAMLSPNCVPFSTTSAAMCSTQRTGVCSIRKTEPISSTIPVNMTLPPLADANMSAGHRRPAAAPWDVPKESPVPDR